MRPLEIVLLAVTAFGFATALLPLRGRLRHARHLAPAAPVAAVVQALVEGYRWQLVPAYVLIGVLEVGRLVSWWRTRRVPAGRPVRRRALHLVARGVAAAVVVLMLAIAAAVPLAVPVFTFPRPSGPYGIGTMTYHWIDQDRPELCTASPDDHREVMVQLWYPARPEPSAPRVPYVPDAAILAPLARLAELPGFSFSHLGYVRTHAV